MNEHTFEDALDKYGCDLTHWPAQIRADANALVESSSQVRNLLKAQASVDEMLEVAMVVPQTYGLEGKIIEYVREVKPRYSLSYWLQYVWKPAFAAIFSLAFGFYLGAANQDFSAEIEEDLAIVTFYDYESWSEDIGNGT